MLLFKIIDSSFLSLCVPFDFLCFTSVYTLLQKKKLEVSRLGSQVSILKCREKFIKVNLKKVIFRQRKYAYLFEPH